MAGDNVPGADDQQERPGSEQWVVGFVDGKGCFSVPIFRNAATRLGWQAQPEFAVSQGISSISVLHDLERSFGCGRVVINSRHDDHREDMANFSVRRLSDLDRRIIPFFERNPLRTAKRESFEAFALIVRKMLRKEHLTVEGMTEIARMAASMNRVRRSRFLESSEAIRQSSHIQRVS